jgi:hypothetical protein
LARLNQARIKRRRFFIKGANFMKAFKLRTIVFSIAAALLGQTGHAVLERTGPTDPANGFPNWFQDTTGVTLELCLPLTPAELTSLACALPPADVPATPEVFPGQFFVEHFWWRATTTLTTAIGSKAVMALALEGAFRSDIAPGKQLVFSRIRVRLIPAPADGIYRFIHPYGEESIVGTAGQRIFFTDDVGIGAPGDFTGATKGRLGPFLLASPTPGGTEMAPVPGAVPGKLYIADPARTGPVTGSPLPDFMGSDGKMHNHNIFRIEGPKGSNLGGVGVDFIETTDFALSGRVYTGQIPSLVVPQRATYMRSSGGVQKVDVFAGAFSSASSRLPGGLRPAAVAPVTSFFNAPCGTTLDAAGNFLAYAQPASNALESQMTAQKNFRWGQSHIASGAPLPDSVCLKDNSAVDVNGRSIPAYNPLPVNDTVKVTDTLFDPANSTLTVKATSSDQVVQQTLTLADFNAPLVGGVVTVSGVTSPPATVRVLSSARGMGESTEMVTGNASTPLISQAPVSTLPPQPVPTLPPAPPPGSPPPATVPPNPAETIGIAAADYVVSQNRWKVAGSTSDATAHDLTLKLSGSCNASGRVIGTTTSIGNTYAFDFRNATGLLDPRTTNCTVIRVESALGNTSPDAIFRLK